MILDRFYDDKLAQASYLVGCAATGEALIVDPNRDADQYMKAADARGLRIVHVTETHIHADFVSGTRELASRTGAQAYLSDEGDESWKYEFAHSLGAELLKNGDSFMVGNIKLEVVHTPGHTPEHVCFIVTDTAASRRPMGVFSGDFIFVGAVGRPDLLEKAARIEGTMETSARQLYQSLQRFRELPDYLQIWPGHGAGSACGKSLGAVPQSSLGYEKLVSQAFNIEAEDEFVSWVLADQPAPPSYFAEMKRINKLGPPLMGELRRPERLPESRLGELIARGSLIIDTRPWPEYSAGHVAGTLNLPLNRAFIEWAGWLLPYDRDLYLIVDDSHGSDDLEEAVRDLALIGLDRVRGYFNTGADALWDEHADVLETLREVTPADLADDIAVGTAAVIDVRSPEEWQAGHIPEVPNIPLGQLAERADEIPPGVPVVLHCQSGNRSAIAASLLRARGLKEVGNLVGGIDRWIAEGYPVERDGA